MGVKEFPNGASFFERTQDEQGGALLSRQIGLSEPAVAGLQPITEPIVPSRSVRSRLHNFDPEIYDLRDTSHLMRLLRALMGASGVGGYQRSAMINRLSNALSGTHFADLDGFWGALFGAPRLDKEQGGLDPATDAADSTAWDAAHSRDASYRNRLHALAQGFAAGGTVAGVTRAAEALLDCEVDLIENWALIDAVQTGPTPDNTWFQVASTSHVWSAVEGRTYATLEGHPPLTESSDRSEVIIRPHRAITQDERKLAHQALDLIKPAGCWINITDGEDFGLAQVPVRSLWADSEDWDVISSVQPSTTILTPEGEVYSSPAAVEAARPAFGRFSGEQWSYAPRVATVVSYALVDGEAQSSPNFQTVVYSDGDSHDYVPSESLIDQRQAQYARLAAEGVQTTYPYSVQR